MCSGYSGAGRPLVGCVPAKRRFILALFWLPLDDWWPEDVEARLRASWEPDPKDSKPHLFQHQHPAFDAVILLVIYAYQFVFARPEGHDALQAEEIGRTRAHPRKLQKDPDLLLCRPGQHEV